MQLEHYIKRYENAHKDPLDLHMALEQETKLSDQKQIISENIIFSDIICIEEKRSYAFIQLNGFNSSFQLLLASGEKNGPLLSISLYKNNVLQKRSNLHDSLNWRLGCLGLGHYHLHIDKTLAMSFEISNSLR